MKSIIVLCSLLLAPLSLSAHDTWLQATSASARPGDTVALQLTSGEGFKGLGSGPSPDRVSRTFLRLGEQTTSLSVGDRTEQFLAFVGRPDVSGVALFAVELKPRDLELKPDSIAAYFDEIHAGPELRAEWEKLPAPRRWRERYTKSSTTFVRVGELAPDDLTWSRPAGLALEIVPQNNPTTLRAGDVFKVRLIGNGAPLAGLPLDFVYEGETRGHVIATDAEGCAAARLDRPGRWLVRCTNLIRSTQPDLEWESHFSTLVIEIAPAR